MSINVREFYALFDLPLLARCAYFALRWRMDDASGKVGDRYRVSYRWLAEALEVPAVPGRRSEFSGKPTLKALRHALDTLVKAGLLDRGWKKQELEFLCLLASRNEGSGQELAP